MMPEQEPKCPYGADSDIDARYLAGALSAEETEAFEEHYFGCDRCFAAVQRGAEIRAAMSSRVTVPSTEAKPRVIPIRSGRRRLSPWHPALVAAALVIVALGIRRTVREPVSERSVAPPSVDAARGTAQPLTLRSHATSTVLVAAWSALPTARSYRVRLVATDGSLLFERETPDTSIMVSRDRLPGKGLVYWEVQALNALRSIVATSPVVQAQTSPDSP